MAQVEARSDMCGAASLRVFAVWVAGGDARPMRLLVLRALLPNAIDAEAAVSRSGRVGSGSVAQLDHAGRAPRSSPAPRFPRRTTHHPHSRSQPKVNWLLAPSPSAIPWDFLILLYK